MKRRDALKVMTGLAATSAWAGPATARQGPAGEMPLPEMMHKLMPTLGSIPIRVAAVTPSLTLLSGPGGNIAALAGPDGILVVDSFVRERGADLAAAIRKLGAGPVTLVNTHWHADHTGGNAAIREIAAGIIAHENTRKRLGADQYMADFEMKVPASPPEAIPSLTFDDSLRLYRHDGEEIELVHVAPAHTDSDIFVHFRKANILHTGDLFTNGNYPNIDSSSGGWIGGMVEAADRILGIVDARTKIIPGHGPLATRDDLKAFRDMLAAAREKIEPLVAAGKTVDEAVAARPLADLDARWARGPFKGGHFTRIVYSGLAKHRQKA